jgi:hypothetical protein
MKLLQTISREIGQQEMTSETVIALIDAVDRDPLAGQGKYSKKELLADRIAAQWKICAAQMKGLPARDAKPVVVDKP